MALHDGSEIVRFTDAGNCNKDGEKEESEGDLARLSREEHIGGDFAMRR